MKKISIVSMFSALLFVASFLSGTQVNADNFNGRQIKVLSGDANLFGPFASRMVGDSFGRICSRQYGVLDTGSNRIVSACKVCFTDKFSHENWPTEDEVKRYHLVSGDIITIKYTNSGGENLISQAYGCSYGSDGKSYCHGANFSLYGVVSRTSKELAVMCTSDLDLSRSSLNEIFKGIFEFTPHLAH